MNNPIPDWLIPWLNRPGWQILSLQWSGLAGLVLLTCIGLLADQWQRYQQLDQQRQQLELQIAEHQKQWDRLPALEELELRLQQAAEQPDPQKERDIAGLLQQVGGELLRWQQQDKPPQQKVTVQVKFDGLLHFLAGISSTQRIGQIRIERQPTGLMTQLTLLVSDGAGDNSPQSDANCQDSGCVSSPESLIFANSSGFAPLPSVLSADERDPFQPPQAVPCIRPITSPENWQLKGSIGTEDLRYGWVVTPQGQWLGLLPQQRLLDGYWQVAQVHPRKVELAMPEIDSACSPQVGNLVLALEEKR
ncbi:DNA utilization family protein [Serratia sp. DD3]|uniref:DNA utilization family protein n=1 Tax=Serratia sp. DD3 TaxID=1410619 RepID=UPI0003C4F823|nr:DNA utilization family protein [Serratia sp. DD3]KEY58660.1 hypothetical protein SRDD_23560 [Serratia sp. DD3]